MVNVEQSAAYEAVYESGVSGGVGVVAIRVEDNQGAVVFGPTTGGISELGTTGIYVRNMTAPAGIGQYTIVWSLDGTFSAGSNTIEDLVVVTAGSSGSLPPLPPVVGGGPDFGPCSAWTTSEAVAECCSVDVGSMTSLFDNSITAATEILWMLSGRMFSGLCQRTVRPCSTERPCGFQVLSRGHIVGWDGGRWVHDENPCGCRSLDEVLLAGYPVREIVEVLVDGVVVDPDTYRLDGYRWLRRVRDPVDPDTILFWPSCQHLDLDSTEVGTFEVTYTYGQDPPMIAQEAAKQLACQVYLGCTGSDACQLPQGTTRVTRQGITIERTFFARDPRTAAWRTGLTLVDAFLNAVNPYGLTRRPVMLAPGQSRGRYAPSVGS